MGSFIEDYVINPIEQGRRADRYEKAAKAMYDFITNHMAIVGHDEVFAWAEVKKVYAEALNGA